MSTAIVLASLLHAAVAIGHGKHGVRAHRNRVTTPTHVSRFNPGYGKICGKQISKTFKIMHNTGIAAWGHGIPFDVRAQIDSKYGSTECSAADQPVLPLRNRIITPADCFLRGSRHRHPGRLPVVLHALRAAQRGGLDERTNVP